MLIILVLIILGQLHVSQYHIDGLVQDYINSLC